MTFSDYLALASALVALSAVVVALRYRQQAVDARAVVAAMGALPDGMVCSTEPAYFTRHFYDGARECRRCGHPSPYPVSVVDEALAVAARAEEQS